VIGLAQGLWQGKHFKRRFGPVWEEKDRFFKEFDEELTTRHLRQKWG